MAGDKNLLDDFDLALADLDNLPLITAQPVADLQPMHPAIGLNQRVADSATGQATDHP
ncbi:hypothetical protein D9M71_445940 [compost metagenome]